MAGTECSDEIETASWKELCHPFLVNRRKGRKYVHGLFQAFTVISLNTAHTLEGSRAECFLSLFILRITFLVFTLVSLPSVLKPLNICDSSQLPSPFLLPSPLAAKNTCCQIASPE